MDSWFKDLRATTQDLAKSAQSQFSDLQQRGSQLTEKLATLGVSSKKDCEFEEGPLGFELEGNLVVVVEEGSQAERLHVQVGDRLVEVDGYKVPKYKEGDLASEEAAASQLRKWLKEMPRPSRLTFKPPKVSEIAAAAATDFELEDELGLGLSMDDDAADVDIPADTLGNMNSIPAIDEPPAAAAAVGDAASQKSSARGAPALDSAKSSPLANGDDGQERNASTADDDLTLLTSSGTGLAGLQTAREDNLDFEIDADMDVEATSQGNAFDLLPLDVGKDENEHNVDVGKVRNSGTAAGNIAILASSFEEPLDTADLLPAAPSDGEQPGSMDLDELEVPPQPSPLLPSKPSQRASPPQQRPPPQPSQPSTSLPPPPRADRTAAATAAPGPRNGGTGASAAGPRLSKDKEKLLEQTQSKLENERKTTARLLQELATARAKAKDIQKSHSKLEAKEKSLQEEVTRLSGLLSGLQGAEGDAARLAAELSAALQKSATLEDELAELRVTATAAQEEKDEASTRACSSERLSECLRVEVERLEVQLGGFQAAHEAELELLREEQEELLRRERRKQNEQEASANQRIMQAQAETEAAHRQLAESKATLKEVRAEAEAVSAESLAARAALRKAEADALSLRERVEGLERERPKALFGGSGSGGGVDDNDDTGMEGRVNPIDDAERGEAVPAIVGVASSMSVEEQQRMQERIGLLERKCATLQRRLSAQVLQARASGPAGQGRSHPPWLQPLIQHLGPRTGVWALAAFSNVDKALRTVTQLILQRSTWLWLFYVHLLVLYLIVASLTWSSSTDPASTVAILNQQMTQAQQLPSSLASSTALSPSAAPSAAGSG